MDTDSNCSGSVPTSVHYNLPPTSPEPVCNKSALATIRLTTPADLTFSHLVSILAADFMEASGPLSTPSRGPVEATSVVRGVCEAIGGMGGSCHTAAIFLCRIPHFSVSMFKSDGAFCE